MYLSNNTRPDICYAVGRLARFMAKPGVHHTKFAMGLLKYIKGTKTVGMVYSGRLKQRRWEHTIYTGATWATKQDRVSFQGMVVIRYGGAVCWLAQRQKSTALSSMEAEIMVACEGAKEAAWLEKITLDLGERSISNPFVPTLHCDNYGGVQWMEKTQFHAKVKHIETKWMFIRNDMVWKNRLTVSHIA